MIFYRIPYVEYDRMQSIKYKNASLTRMSEDGTLLLIGSNKGTVELLGKWKKCIDIGSTTTRFTFTISPDNLYFTITSSFSVDVYRVSDGTQIRHFETYRAKFLDIRWSPCSRYIACCFDDLMAFTSFYIKVWDVLEDSVKLSEQFGYVVNSVYFSPDGKYLANTLNDGPNDSEVYIWDTTTWKVVRKLKNYGIAYPWVLSWSPDGKHIVSGGRYKKMTVWDTASWEPRQYTTSAYNTLDISWCANSHYMASVYGGSIQVVELETSRVIESYSLNGEPPNSTMNSKSVALTCPGEIHIYEPNFVKFSNVLLGILRAHARNSLSDPRLWYAISEYTF